MRFSKASYDVCIIRYFVTVSKFKQTKALTSMSARLNMSSRHIKLL